MAVITVSSQVGTRGDMVVRQLAGKLNCKVLSRQFALDNFYGKIAEGARTRLNESPKFYLNLIPDTNITYKDKLVSEFKKETELAELNDNDLIILGAGGTFALNNVGVEHISVRIIGSVDLRIANIEKINNIPLIAAKETLNVGDRRSKRFVSTLFEQDINDFLKYDITICMDKMSTDEATATILSLVQESKLRRAIKEETENNDSMDHQSKTVVFKNSTEEEFAAILDMYGIEWKYEPKTFPIEWDIAGNITMAFSPDFYLPKFDMYLELTIMDQKYVTKKNKKMRKVKELYPGTNVKIVYKKDFEELVKRMKEK